MKHSPGFEKLVEETKKKIKEISIQEVLEKQKNGSSFILIDVREESEWAAGHASGAIYMGRGIIERDIENQIPNPHTEIVLYCGGGFRSALSADSLQKMGYTNVSSMRGGMRAWRELGCKEEKA